MTAHPHTNRLIHEKSPYLLQHAHNPVDWFPWGQEAFDLAKNQDKPIFLSIGYATCHWCHVMEKESFEDLETARLMNDAFINIKVDREELPEVDSLYMEFAQVLMSSAGGWPLNVILTSDLKPFFAVTYLPPKTKRGLMGLQQFIHHIKVLWQSEERQRLLEQADKLLQIFEKNAVSVGQQIPSEKNIVNCIEMIFELADPIYGGMKGEPKFPFGYQANFLLEYSQIKTDSRALFCVELTLENMYRGGIYDHLGGGFSRYAIDEKWKIPHFEKMLYDNALIARAYLDAWKYTKNGIYQRVCEETLGYAIRECTLEEGAFSSAEDADSEGREGAFYLWTLQEIQQTLSVEQRDVFCQLYSVTPEGNFEGKNILYLTELFEPFAEERGLDWKELMPKIEWARQALFKKRSLRPRPFKDDKVISSWNGLMIDAMIKAGYVLKKEPFIEAGVRAAKFVRAHLWSDGKLYRRWREGEKRFYGCLDDYAFMIKGCLALFEEGQGTEWLQWAIEMAAVLERDFKTPDGAFYFSEQNEALLMRRCDFYDGAEPSGNSVHAENLIRLFQITGSELFLTQAQDILRGSKQHMETYPPGACYMLMSLSRYLNIKAPTLVIALNEKEQWKDEIQHGIHSVYKPHLQVVWLRQDDQALLSLAPALVDKNRVGQNTTAHICYPNRCESPLNSLPEILQAIRDL